LCKKRRKKKKKNKELNISNTSPIYFCTNSAPDTRMKVQSVWCATALASRVFPVPNEQLKKKGFLIRMKSQNKRERGNRMLTMNGGI
jgi:hypothetical protein